ncbi:hypothetical protein EON65_25045 [archaeon]|nr:MAG: hypothetical protein EON65_25045 [archaeon]
MARLKEQLEQQGKKQESSLIGNKMMELGGMNKSSNINSKGKSNSKSKSQSNSQSPSKIIQDSKKAKKK